MDRKLAVVIVVAFDEEYVAACVIRLGRHAGCVPVRPAGIRTTVISKCNLPAQVGAEDPQIRIILALAAIEGDRGGPRKREREQHIVCAVAVHMGAADRGAGYGLAAYDGWRRGGRCWHRCGRA